MYINLILTAKNKVLMCVSLTGSPFNYQRSILNTSSLHNEPVIEEILFIIAHRLASRMVDDLTACA